MDLEHISEQELADMIDGQWLKIEQKLTKYMSEKEIDEIFETVKNVVSLSSCVTLKIKYLESTYPEIFYTKKKMKQANINQNQLAKMVGITNSRVQNILSYARQSKDNKKILKEFNKILDEQLA